MIARPQCSKRRCRHLLGVLQPTGSEEGGERPYCAAFPEGIPDAIAYGDNPHTTPYPGDGGVQYEPESV